jgi:alkaline phosphatase
MLQLGRRAFLKHSTLMLAAAAKSGRLLAADAPSEPLRFGLITDLHHADKPPAGTRYYRETLTKLAEAAKQFERDKLAFVVELGDFIDAAATPEIELGYLERVNRDFKAIANDRHYVLGNHCVDMLTKREFLGAIGRTESYYSFDRGGWHFVVLDSCFRSDGKPYGRKSSDWKDANIPPHELEWLTTDLAKHQRPTIVFAHQRLDESGVHAVRNAAQVRAILEKSGRVQAVFQGHSHENAYQDIAGIHYCTLVAMIEGSGPEHNGYSTVEMAATGDLRLTGFRQQESRTCRT